MPELKLNHYVPRFLLDNWNQPCSKSKPGPWVLREKDGRVPKHHCGGKHKYAAQDNIYIIEDGVRYTNAERWFSGIEAVFSKLVHGIVTHTLSNDMFEDSELELLSLYVVTQTVRHPDMLADIEEKIRANPSLAEVLNGVHIDDAKEASIMSVVNTSMHRVSSIKKPEFEVLEHTMNDAIISDFPVLHLQEEYYMPVSPRHLLLMRSASSPSCNVVPVEGRGMIDQINEVQIASSLRWLVGSSDRAILDALNSTDSEPFIRKLNLKVGEVSGNTPGWSMKKSD